MKVLYASLYPSIYRQFNLGPNTQIGMIIIPDQISDHENRQKNPAYTRGGQFIEDFQSHVWLEVGTRWFGLADVTELIRDTNEFFTNIVSPMYGLRVHDDNGLINPIYFYDDTKPHFGMVFDHDDIRPECFVPFDMNKAKEWRANATANPNQSFR